MKIGSPAYTSVKRGDVEFLDIITEVNGEPCMMESEFQDSVRSKTRPQLTLKRNGAMPSVKKLLSEGMSYAAVSLSILTIITCFSLLTVEEKHFSATHIMVLQKTGGEYDFGFKPVFIKEQVHDCTQMLTLQCTLSHLVLLCRV